MDNNIIANNNCTAVQTINPGLNLSIRHNTITGNSQAGILFGAAATGEVFNNIIAGQGADGLYTATGSSVAVSHNLFWKNASVTSPGMNAVIADPLLSADGHLMRGSPAVNAGFLTPLDVDFDGDLRPIAGLPDIGADEQLLATFLPVAMR
jgi:hypothetical protein